MLNAFTRIATQILPEKSAQLMSLNVFALWARLKKAQAESYPEIDAFWTADALLGDPPKDGNAITPEGDAWNELHWKSDAARCIVELES